MFTFLDIVTAEDFTQVIGSLIYKHSPITACLVSTYLNETENSFSYIFISDSLSGYY